MSGWHSFDTVGTFHAAFLISGSIVAALLIATGATVLYYARHWHELVAIVDRARAKYLPYWQVETKTLLHNGLVEIAIVGCTALLALCYATHQYGSRR